MWLVVVADDDDDDGGGGGGCVFMKPAPIETSTTYLYRYIEMQRGNPSFVIDGQKGLGREALSLKKLQILDIIVSLSTC